MGTILEFVLDTINLRPINCSMCISCSKPCFKEAWRTCGHMALNTQRSWSGLWTSPADVPRGSLAVLSRLHQYDDVVQLTNTQLRGDFPQSAKSRRSFLERITSEIIYLQVVFFKRKINYYISSLFERALLINFLVWTVLVLDKIIFFFLMRSLQYSVNCISHWQDIVHSISPW